MTEEGVTSEASANPQKGRPAEDNLRAMAKKLEALEADKAKMAERLQEYDSRFKAFAGHSEPEDEEDFTFLSKKEFKNSSLKERENLKKEILEEIQKESHARKQEMFFHDHPDFHSVVNEENIKKLEEYDPNFASVLSMVPDKLAQYKAAYGKVKEMQEKSVKKSSAPHPYATVSPFGVGSTPVMQETSSWNEKSVQSAARKRLEDMKRGFVTGV